MKKVNQQNADDLLKDRLKLIGSPPHNMYRKKNLTHCKFPFGSGSIEMGFEFFRFNRVSHFFHIEAMPKKLGDLQKLADMVANMLAYDKKLEVFIDGDFEKDIQSGKIFHPSTHEVVRMFKTKGAVEYIEKIIKCIDGTIPSSYANKMMNGRTDFDFYYANL